MSSSTPPDSLDTVSRYLHDTRDLSSPAEVAAATVQHVRELTGAAWAEMAEVRPGGTLTLLASSDPQLSRDLMAAREEAGGPPAPAAALDEQTLVVDDLAQGRWWPEFAELASARTGVRGAVLAFLSVPGRGDAVLAVSDPRPGWFADGRDRGPRLLADLAASALARAGAVDEAHHLRLGLAAGRRIGTAVGVLATRRGVQPDEAFALLRTASQHRNQKLGLLAEEVLAGDDLRGS